MKQFQQWIPLVVFLVVTAIVCLLSAATPDRIDSPRPIECPYQTDTPPCSYHWGNR